MILTIKDLTTSCSCDHSNPHCKGKLYLTKIRIKSRKEKLITWALGGPILMPLWAHPHCLKEREEKLCQEKNIKDVEITDGT